MNAITRYVVLGAAGMLILQLAVVASAQEIARVPASGPASSASSAGKVAAAESSQSQDPPGTSAPPQGTIAQPDKAGGMGDPAFGGTATRFIGFQNRTQWT